jgi:hypothetical protein
MDTRTVSMIQFPLRRNYIQKHELTATHAHPAPRVDGIYNGQTVSTCAS